VKGQPAIDFPAGGGDFVGHIFFGRFFFLDFQPAWRKTYFSKKVFLLDFPTCMEKNLFFK